MKNIITVLILFLTLPTFAQNDLEGTWYGIVISDGGINKVVRQEWTFDRENIHITYFLPPVERPKSRITDKGVFPYEILDNKLVLKQGEFDYVFDIKEHTESQLVLEQKEDNQKLIFQKQGVNSSYSYNLDETTIPSFVSYQINTANNEFEDIELSFLNVKDWLVLLDVKENRGYNVKPIRDTLKDNINQIDLLCVNILRENLKSIIFETINDEMISGLINGSIPFTLNKIERKSLSVKQDFVNHTFLSDFNDMSNIVCSPNKKNIGTKKNIGNKINIGKQNCYFKNDTIAIVKRYEALEIANSIVLQDESSLGKKLSTDEMKWYLDSKGQNIYLHYDDEKYREMIFKFQINKNDGQLIPFQNEVYVF